MNSNWKLFHLFVFAIIFVIAIFFRTYNLGYSNFQGDEVKSQGYLFDSKPFSQFLLSNSKGPGQYLITKAINGLSITKNAPETYLRLPFALAGMLAIFILYLLMIEMGKKKSQAAVAMVLAGSSGLLIAFSRLIQYQSFVILMGVISIYLILKYLNTYKQKFLVLAGLSSSIGFLFHFDGLSYVIPISLVLLINTKQRKNIILYLLPFLTSFFFYVPYLFNSYFQSTFDYIYYDRTFSYFHFDSIFYSVKLLTVYHSMEFLILIGTGVSLWVYNRTKYLHNIYKAIFIVLLLLLFARYFNENPRRLLIYLSTSLLGFGIILALYEGFKNELLRSKLRSISSGKFFSNHSSSQQGCEVLWFKNKQSFSSNEKNLKELLIEIWFMFSFLVYAMLMNKPLTHIYNFIIPAIILTTLQISKLNQPKIIYPLLILVLIGTSSFNYQAFLESKIEYPWQKESYIYGQMYSEITNGEKIRGIFGFPYNRNLKELKKDMETANTTAITNRYISNDEFNRIKYYMMGYQWSDQKPYYFINIHNVPETDGQNTNITNEKLIINNDGYDIYLIE